MALVRVNIGYYKTTSAAMVVAILAWIIKCMTGNAAFPKPPVPLVAAVPPDPTAPVDMTTRMNALAAANAASVDSGTAQTAARDAALEFAYEGMDANAFYCQTQARTNLALFLTSGYQAASTNRAQTQLVTPSITGIDNDISTQLNVHLTPIANAVGYEVQTCIGTAAWTTVKFSTQARTIALIGLVFGTNQHVRARALGGSTEASQWSQPMSCIVH